MVIGLHLHGAWQHLYSTPKCFIMGLSFTHSLNHSLTHTDGWQLPCKVSPAAHFMFQCLAQGHNSSFHFWRSFSSWETWVVSLPLSEGGHRRKSHWLSQCGLHPSCQPSRPDPRFPGIGSGDPAHPARFAGRIRTSDRSSCWEKSPWAWTEPCPDNGRER